MAAPIVGIAFVIETVADYLCLDEEDVDKLTNYFHIAVATVMPYIGGMCAAAAHVG